MKILNLLTDSFFKILLPGLKVTVPLTVISFTLSTILGTITALVQFANIKGLKQFARFYIWVIRGTPLLIQLFVVFYGLPSVGIIIDPFPAAVIVFSINEGAYSAETIRGALEAVPKGQIEAGYCSGLNFVQIMWHIVLPQAFRIAFPSLANALIAMVKNTSLAANITVMEMFMVTQQIVARTYEALALYLELAFIYLIFSTVLTRLQTYAENKLNERGAQR
ncbi:MAG: amino acid ABC transporter permease [Erysipelotrichaceae bacterium]|nr:amino acid ABC transporter permease [Erysipelotrichaceae bacterium]MBP5279927.1 amino acid ABC transporter permease [Erysipelotrichaceae bacterium]